MKGLRPNPAQSSSIKKRFRNGYPFISKLNCFGRMWRKDQFAKWYFKMEKFLPKSQEYVLVAKSVRSRSKVKGDTDRKSKQSAPKTFWSKKIWAKNEDMSQTKGIFSVNHSKMSRWSIDYQHFWNWPYGCSVHVYVVNGRRCVISH